MNRTILIKIPADLPTHAAYRARHGVGAMAMLRPAVPAANLISRAGGIRAVARLARLSKDTVLALSKGKGSLRSYTTMAAALGFSVQVEDGKSRRWRALHSSAFQCWETPPELWQSILVRLNISHFDLDPCSPRNDGPVAAIKHFTERDNGLLQSWHGHIWVNPPYGRALSQWIDKAIQEHQHGRATIAALVPSRTGTQWWHRAIASGARPEFLAGRIRFWRDGQPGDTAPFDSAILWWLRRDDDSIIQC
ncbi:MAG: DNA N-6-adenine-methyltransferase [Acidocella sp.]|nr:DNA N-6-adenine-methyltransferase [Acidocella sp.]